MSFPLQMQMIDDSTSKCHSLRFFISLSFLFIHFFFLYGSLFQTVFHFLQNLLLHHFFCMRLIFIPDHLIVSFFLSLYICHPFNFQIFQSIVFSASFLFTIYPPSLFFYLAILSHLLFRKVIGWISYGTTLSHR